MIWWLTKNHQSKHEPFCFYTRFFLLFLVWSVPTEPKLHSILTFPYPVYTVTTWDTQGKADFFGSIYTFMARTFLLSFLFAYKAFESMKQKIRFFFHIYLFIEA